MSGQMPTFNAQGIFCIDTELQRPGFDAAWLVIEQGRAAFIDCGTSHAVPAMLQALADAGLGPGRCCGSSHALPCFPAKKRWQQQ